ncbi:MAG: mechanosensitive ion channel family protein [Gammaproteobacteria bacterium]|nr:MAG: mechanosensitive ion channel family protein [Gammaproteobacteria bacterium]
MQDNALYQALIHWAGDNAWIVQVFIVVLLVLLFNFILRMALRRLHKKLQVTDIPWDDAFVGALQRPLNLMVWIIGIAFAAEIVHTETGAAIFKAIGPIRDVGVIACIAWFLQRLVKQVQINLLKRSKAREHPLDQTTVDAIGKLVSASIIITAALVVLQTLGFSISGVLAFGGIGGIAIGFAAKDLLANFFGGLMIYLDRPFAVGDWIKSPDREIEGTVEYIGWRLTRIRTFDKRPIYIPNGIFSTIAVVNPSRMSHRRINETIGIRYADIEKMQAIVDGVKAMLQQHEDIDDSQTLMVNFNSFAPSSVDFFIYTFTHTTHWVRFHEIKQDVLLKISDIIMRHGAEIAFPTSTVHVSEPVQLAGTAPAASPVAAGN